MPSDSTKPTRWRPRFSVRTLVVIVTLVCAYAACWGPTKERGRDDVIRHCIEDLGAVADAQLVDDWRVYVKATAPLLVSEETSILDEQLYIAPRTNYYFWFFGYVVKLPYERNVTVARDDDNSGIVDVPSWDHELSPSIRRPASFSSARSHSPSQ